MLILADARQIPLRDTWVQCVVTSPPYFGLRDYGTAGQIGLEASPDEYVAQLVGVFREVRRVLKDDGTVWLNIGDSYANDAKWGGSSGGKHAAALHGNTGIGRGRQTTRLKGKNLIGIPWRVAFALQDDGWCLRSDIIWHKPNPMPESVTDRPTKAHEYLFLLAKSERYYFDADAISEPLTPGTKPPGNRHSYDGGRPDGMTLRGDRAADYLKQTSRNRRTVWTVPTMPYRGAHFATMPEALVTPCILAGSRLGDLVFDPFMGSGTVGAVASRLGRRWVGIDLNPAYHKLAKKRTAQRGLMPGDWAK